MPGGRRLRRCRSGLRAVGRARCTDLNFSDQVVYVIIAGAGMGFMLTPASTDAVNRASRLSYGEATGITQTVRNYAASLGLAILGTILVDQLRSRVTTSLVCTGRSAQRRPLKHRRSRQTQGGHVGTIPHFVRLDFAYSTQTVFYVMCGIMGVAAIVARLGLQRGLQREQVTTDDYSHEEPQTEPGLAT